MTQFTTKLDLYKPGGGSGGSNVPDEQADIDKLNDNFDIIDAAVGAEICTSGTRPATPYDGKIIFETDTKRFRTWRQSNTTWEAGATSRGQLTQYLVTDPTALDAISDGTIGDSAWMTTPGTGINALRWVAHAGTGTGLDWRPDNPVISDTKAHLDTFIAAIAAITNTRFEIGGMAIVTGSRIAYLFTSAVGAYLPLSPMVPIVPTLNAAVTGVSIDSQGIVNLSAVVADFVLNGAMPVDFTHVVAIIKLSNTVSASPLQVQFCSGGTPVATGYDQIRTGTAQTTNLASQDLNSNVAEITTGTSAFAGRMVGDLHIYDAPTAGQITTMIASTFTSPNPMTAATTAQVGIRGTQQRVAAAHDGLKFIRTGSGSWSGTIQFYGLV